MMVDRMLTSRDKNDIFWIKKRRYMVSSDYKSKSGRGNFNPDMVAEVKSAYERYPDGLALYELTGNEFLDPPPTASGQMAFAKSIATMMHTLDTIDDEDTLGEVSSDSLVHYFDDIIRDAKVLIKEIIDAYFEGCGVDSEGNEYHDANKKAAAQEVFYHKSKRYENLIKVERKMTGYEVIDAIRKENGIDELSQTDETGVYPALEKLIEENANKAKECAQKLDELRDIVKKDIIEAAGRRAAREALTIPINKRIEELPREGIERQILKSAFNAYLSDVDRNLRWLLYRKQAVYYEARWLLLGEPVDEILASKIGLICDDKPAILFGDAKLSDIAGYIRPEEDEYRDLPDSDAEAIFKLGDEFIQYLSDHPYHFESQSLLSICHNLDELSDMLPKAWAMIQAIDRFTITGEYKELSEDDRQRMFDIWVLSNVICIVGYTICEIIIGDPDKTVKEATETLNNMLPVLSYSETEKEVRKTLAQVIMERSGFHVY